MIKISNLNFSYKGKLPFIIGNLNLTVQKGEYISILGENGSGKSTLIKLILGLLKPTSGDIVIDSKKIGYVPQKFESINSQFPITVMEVLECYRRSIMIKQRHAAEKSLERVNLLNLRKNLIGELSGGQLQRLFIARSLLGDPELLILDEPSNGIDIINQKEIYSLIKSLNTESSITVISVEHNLKPAAQNSSRILLLKEGSYEIIDAGDFSDNYMKNGGFYYAAV